MLFLGIFFVELLILFLFSKALIKSLAQLIFFLSKSREVGVYSLAILFFPGTIIHELSHAIVAGVLMVHVGEVEFTPQIHEGGVKLGSAQVGKTDPIRGALIGVAPVIIGLTIILGLLFFFSSGFLQGKEFSFWVYLLLFYLIFVIGNTMFSSRKDLEGAVGGLILSISILTAFYLLGFREVFIFLNQIISVELVGFFQKSSLFLIVPLVLDFLVILFAKFLVSRKTS